MFKPIVFDLNDQYSNIIRWFGWSKEEVEVAAQDRRGKRGNLGHLMIFDLQCF